MPISGTYLVLPTGHSISITAMLFKSWCFSAPSTTSRSIVYHDALMSWRFHIQVLLAEQDQYAPHCNAAKLKHDIKISLTVGSSPGLFGSRILMAKVPVSIFIAPVPRVLPQIVLRNHWWILVYSSSKGYKRGPNLKVLTGDWFWSGHAQVEIQ